MARPRGYAAWNPKPETLALVGQVQDVLHEYRDHLPLTIRQIFYRLVGAHGYDKTERAYSRLCETLVRARRAQMISFHDIRDDGTKSQGGGGYSSVEAFWRTVKSSGDYFRRDRLAGQPVEIELWCEAAGMLPQLARVASPYSVPVYSTGGFSSVTVTHEIAERALSRDVPTVFLHVGDYDPSGESIFDAMSTDAEHFLLAAHPHRDETNSKLIRDLRELRGPQLRAKRVALTGEQVEEHGLPTAPPKRTDTRSRNWIGETCQAEAMPPDLLASTVRDAIEAELDLDTYDEVIEEERRDRERIAEVLKGVLPEE